MELQQVAAVDTRGSAGGRDPSPNGMPPRRGRVGLVRNRGCGEELITLDVAMAEPPAVDSPLYTLDNAVLTPHLAGSVGQECRRMGRYMVEELERYFSGQPLKWPVTPELAQHSSHRPAATAKPASHQSAKTVAV